MTISHAISTERLVNALQSIALKQQTGCLTIIREDTQRGSEYPQGVEKGNIFFERGDTVFALTGQESGETALFRMLKWKHISCTFTEGMRHTPERNTHERLSGQVPVPHVLHRLDILRLSSMKAQEHRQTPPIGMPALPVSIPAQMPIEMVETQLLPALNLADIPVPTPPEMALPGTPSVQSTTVFQRDTGKHEQITPCDPASQESHESQESHTVPIGVTAIFRALPCATAPIILSRMERRERVVLLLLNGKRTLHDVAMLVHHSETDVARTLVRLLNQRYIEYIGVA